MPRSIIDTESSRPAYVRRNVTLAIGVVVVAIVLALVVFEIARHVRVPA